MNTDVSSGKKIRSSSPTIIRRESWEFEQTLISSNQSQLDILLANLAPDLYVIWQSLILYSLNGEILPPIIKAIGDIAHSSRLGEVIVEIRPDQTTGEAVVRRVRAIDTRHLDLGAIRK